MPPLANPRYLALSDMHFGTPESSINDARYHSALVEHMATRAPYAEIILTGDLLDINLSTLTRAIEGGNWPDLKRPLFGFRQFLEALDSAMKRGGKRLEDLADKWIYVPGNHDFKIWDGLATKFVCDDVLARGDHMGSVPTPLRRHAWPDGTSFFAGLFHCFDIQNKVTVEYPNHAVSFDQAGTMVFTHGHYLDASQTRGNDLAANLRGVTDPKQAEQIVRRIFIETAQYQAVANSVSFTRGTRHFVNDLFGPDSWGNKLSKIGTTVGSWLTRRSFPNKASLRGKKLSAAQLSNIEVYLERFCQCSPLPSWFVFGHTHRQGLGTTAERKIAVFNVGSCYVDRGMPVTFLEVEGGVDGGPSVQLMCVDGNGAVRRSS